MRGLLKAFLIGALATGGSVIAIQGTAGAYPNCERTASAPSFNGDNISGPYSVTCSRSVPQATLTGRIKEDRNNLPDVVHDTESLEFTDDRSSTVDTKTCQDGDAIYTEAQINSESPAQSSRRTMHC